MSRNSTKAKDTPSFDKPAYPPEPPTRFVELFIEEKLRLDMTPADLATVLVCECARALEPIRKDRLSRYECLHTIVAYLDEQIVLNRSPSND